MLYYETFSVRSLMELNQMHTSAARLPRDLALRALRQTDSQEQAQRVGAYILLERLLRKSTDLFRSHVEGMIKPEFTSFFDAHSPLADLRYDNYGKPYFAGHDNASVSISHAGHLVACALVLDEDEKIASPVGIDVQNVEYDVERAKRITERYFSEGEKAQMAALSDQDEDYCRLFTRIWTRKEAYLKYMGVGLSEIQRADTVNLAHPCVFEEKEETLTIQVRGGKTRDELYYITVCTDKNAYSSTKTEEEPPLDNETEALKAENATLRAENMFLKAENESLRTENNGF